MARALEALAQLHASMANGEVRRQLPWLPGYEHFFTTAFDQHLAAVQGQLSSMPSGRQLLAAEPRFANGVRTWLEALPLALQQRVASLWKDPSPILERLRCLPGTAIHGDPGPQHFGLSSLHDRDRLVLIDWEFVAWGPPSLDANHLVMFRTFDHIPSDDYRRWAYEHYERSLAEEGLFWTDDHSRRMAWDLAASLWVLAYGQRHGQVLQRVLMNERPGHPSWRALQREATLLAEALDRWLR